MGDLIVNFTPTGMIPQKAQTPHVPITAAEIIEDVRVACSVGITMAHLHSRDANEGPNWRRADYAEIIRGIRAFAPELVICVSTSGRTYGEYEKRADVLALQGEEKPDMASLTLSSLNFNAQASLNEPSMIMALAGEMKRCGIKPELEAFDSGMVNYAKYLVKKGLVEPPFYFNLILGNIACAQATLLHAGLLANELPDGALCSFGGVGDYQLPVNAMAIAMGYGVRVGLEDNIWWDSERTRLAQNAALLTRVRSIADQCGRRVMAPQELRRLLGLKRGGSDGYGTRE